MTSKRNKIGSSSFRPHRFRSLHLALIAFAIGVFSLSTTASADRIATLSKKLTSKTSEKIRIAAAVSLGRSKDKRALRPLVLALRDDSQLLRAVAAAALGQLGDARALAALQKATKDGDQGVRKRAHQSIGLLRKQASAKADASSARFSTRSRSLRGAYYRVDGRESPRLPRRKPRFMVSVGTATDDAPGKRRRALRKVNGLRLKELMAVQLAASKGATTDEQLAKDLKLPTYSIDMSITRLQRSVQGPWVEMECELRIAISNHRGKMLSFLTGGAKVQVPKSSFKRSQEKSLQEQAIKNSVASINTDLVRYLSRAEGV